MAVLSLSFTVEINNITGKVILRDTSSYPTGVQAGVTGIFDVLQPDRIQRDGSFSSPDIQSGTTEAEIELRTNIDGTIQEGNYSVRFVVHHSSYDGSTLTQEFRISYKRPDVKIVEAFDVFTPSLSFHDGTEYIKGGFQAPTKTRAWDINAGSVGNITGNGQSLDLAISGSYYDAEYEGSLTVTLEYPSSVYSYLTLKDSASASVSTNANTPPSFTTLKDYLKQTKSAFDNLTDCRQTVCARQDFEFASSLLNYIKSRICSGDTMGLQDQIAQYLDIYYNRVSSVYVNTNAEISAYSLDDVGCEAGSSGGSGSDGFPILKTSADFEADGVTLLDDRIKLGVNIFIEIWEVPTKLLSSSGFTQTSEGLVINTGSSATIPDFDASANSYTLLIHKYH